MGYVVKLGAQYLASDDTGDYSLSLAQRDAMRFPNAAMADLAIATMTPRRVALRPAGSLSAPGSVQGSIDDGGSDGGPF